MPPVLAGSWQLKSKLSRAIMGYHWHVLQRALQMWTGMMASVRKSTSVN